jgi:hypothetical protein
METSARAVIDPVAGRPRAAAIDVLNIRDGADLISPNALGNQPGER